MSRARRRGRWPRRTPSRARAIRSRAAAALRAPPLARAAQRGPHRRDRRRRRGPGRRRDGRRRARGRRRRLASGLPAAPLRRRERPPRSSPAAPSSSTSTCSAAERATPARSRSRPPSPFRLPALRQRGPDAAGRRRRRHAAAAGRAAARSWCGPGSRPRTGSRCAPRRSTRRGRRARAGAAATSRPAGEARAARWRSSGCASRSAVDDDLSEFYRRFRRDPLLGPLLRRRPWLPPAPPPLALGGARLGGRQAADRDRAGGPRSSAASSAAGARGWARAAAALRDVPAAATIAGRAPAELGVDGPRAGRARSPCARSPARSPAGAAGSSRRRADRRLLRDPRDRALDGPVPRPLRPRRPRLAAGRRPRLHQAGRPPRRARPPRDGRRGRGVLRALCALPRPRRCLTLPPAPAVLRVRRCATPLERTQSIARCTAVPE